MCELHYEASKKVIERLRLSVDLDNLARAQAAFSSPHVSKGAVSTDGARCSQREARDPNRPRS